MPHDGINNFIPCRFEIAIFVLIFLNMLSMGIEHYDQPHAIFFILEVSNAFFTTVFGLGKVNAALFVELLLNYLPLQRPSSK